MLTSRLGDTCVGFCPAHEFPQMVTGIIMGGAFNVMTNMMPTARMGDMVQGSCGHTANIVSGSATVRSGGMGNARMGDSVAGVWTGTVMQGSPNVFSGA
jgi:uncharacterized Zn-binding protein involved in type VI secretion